MKRETINILKMTIHYLAMKWLPRGLLCMFLLTGLRVCAQEKEDWYLKKVLDNSSGLPQNSIVSIYFDNKTGFLWLTTESGVVRYDGVDPYVFDKRTHPNMKTGRMSVFFSTVKEGVFSLEKGGNLLYNIAGSRVNEYKKDGIEVPDLLYAYFKGSFNSISSMNEILRRIPFNEKRNLSNYDFYGSPFSILALTDSTWLSYSADFFKVYNGKTLIGSWKKPVAEVPTLINSGNHAYALNDNGSGFFIEPEKMSCKRISSTDTAFLRGKPVIFFDPVNKQPLLLNGNKLYKIRFSAETVAADYVATLQDLPNNVVSILIHPKGNLIFAGTTLNGLFVYEKNPFKTYKAQGKLNITGKIDVERNNIYACVMPDSDHIITSTSVLFDLKTGGFSTLPFLNSQPLSLLSDKDKKIWYAYSDTLFKLGYRTHKPEVKIPVHPGRNSPLKINVLKTMLQSSHGKIWVSTLLYIGYLENDNLIEYISFPNDFVFECLAESSTGELFGGNISGVYRIDTLKKQLVLLDKVKAKSVRSLYIDKEQHCWITTYGNGFFMYDLTTEKFYSFPVDSKGYLLFSHVFCDDGKGNFLVPTNRGLFRINKAHLLNIAGGTEKNLFYQYFDINSGLLGNEFNGGCSPAYNKLPNGNIFFPSLNGLVRVNVNLLPETSDYPLFINRVDTKNASYTDSTGYNFSKDERSITWNLCFAQWEQQYSPGLSYKLDNDTGWTYLPEGARSIQLTELKGGDHHLYIRYKTGFLPQAFSSLTVPFNIAKKYYEFPLFWIICLALMLVIIYVTVRVKTKNLDRINTQLENKVTEKTKELVLKNAELNEILTDLQETNLFKSRLISLLGHDIMIPLQYIGKVALQLKMYYEQLNKDTILGSVGDIHITSSQILLYCESLIHWVKLQNSKFIPQLNSAFLVSDILNELTAFHLPFNAEKGNRIVIEADHDLFFYQDPLLVKIILHNLLLNASKFTAGGTITIKAHTEDNLLILTVEDTGKGMTAEKVLNLNNFKPLDSNPGTNQEKGWGIGYTIIMDLLKFANGSLFVESRLNEGTTVTIRLPLYEEAE